MELVKSHVVFDPDTHTYTAPDGRHLQGITGMLSRQLFPDKYAFVDEETLRKAAERGSMVHSVCELVDAGFPADSPEANGYKQLKEAIGLVHEASEYIVSDNEHFASPIDKVYRESENEFSLADVKTTYKYDSEYVRWQLSIYAFFFERQNPGAKVKNLYGIWLRGDRHEIHPEERIPAEIVDSLLQCEITGEQFINPFAVQKVECDLPKRYEQLEDAIVEIAVQEKLWSDRKKEMTQGIKEEMAKAGVTKWTGRKVSFTRTEDYEREDFDKKRFAADHPELYMKYLTKTKCSGQIRLKTL